MNDIPRIIPRPVTHIYCPRCTGAIPNERTPGLYPGAISRADNDTEVCSACGSDEAIRKYSTGVMIPVADWPIQNAHQYGAGYLA